MDIEALPVTRVADSATPCPRFDEYKLKKTENFPQNKHLDI